MPELTALVVDDEALARTELQAMLDGQAHVRVVAEAEDLMSARAAVAAHDPDVVFLDIQLVDESGFDLLPHLPAETAVVFITAYDQYAVRAFEVNALDYLLKPVRADRLERAVRRVLDDASAAPVAEAAEQTPDADPAARTTDGSGAAEPAAGSAGTSARQPADEPATTLERDDYLFLRMNDRRRFVKVGTIKCIRAAGNYARVYTADGTRALVHKPLREWEARLPGSAFLRIHRSAIVNLDYVEDVDAWGGYSYRVHIQGLDEPLAMSRRYAARITDRLG